MHVAYDEDMPSILGNSAIPEVHEHLSMLTKKKIFKKENKKHMLHFFQYYTVYTTRGLLTILYALMIFSSVSVHIIGIVLLGC